MKPTNSDKTLGSEDGETPNPGVTAALCFGDSTGTIEVFATGGTPGYNYSWSHSSLNSPVAGGLSSGTYTINVSDSNACDAMLSVYVSQPSAPLSTESSLKITELERGEITWCE